MSMRQQLWQTVQQKYLDGLDSMSLSQDHLDKIDSLVLSPDVSRLRQGLELLLASSPEYLWRFLDFENDSVKLNASFPWVSYQQVEAIFLDVMKREPTARNLYVNGAFESMEFRVLGYRALDELSEPERDLCVRLSKEMVHVPAGEFMMGALDDDYLGEDNEFPRHRVVFTNGLLVGKYSVTQVLWENVIGSHPSKFKGANRPVEQVSWFDCLVFCNALSKQEGFSPVYAGLESYVVGSKLSMDAALLLSDNITLVEGANGYRLLTEAEWEYSARGGEYHHYSGSDNIDEVAWYGSNSGNETHSVGQKKPNGYGIYDMSGNVAEWCWDSIDCVVHDESEEDVWLRSGSKYPNTTRVNPQGPSHGFYRSNRGGCIFYFKDRVRVSFRGIEIEDDANDPHGIACGGGLRIARSLP